MRVGFTGTQRGMTSEQRRQVGNILRDFEWCETRIFCHGGCVGADEEAAEIAKNLGWETWCFPSNIENKQSTFENDWCAAPKDPLERNRDIVDHSYIMIAAPKEYNEVLRSGTWATIRYASGTKTTLYTIYPGGGGYTVERE